MPTTAPSRPSRNVADTQLGRDHLTQALGESQCPNRSSRVGPVCSPTVHQGRERACRPGRQPGGEQHSGQPGEDVPGSGRSQPGRRVGLRPDRALGRLDDQGRGALKQDRGPAGSRQGPGMAERIGLNAGAVDGRVGEAREQAGRDDSTTTATISAMRRPEPGASASLGLPPISFAVTWSKRGPL